MEISAHLWHKATTTVNHRALIGLGWHSQHQGSSNHGWRRDSCNICWWRSEGGAPMSDLSPRNRRTELHQGGAIHYQRWGQQWVWWRWRRRRECHRRRCLSHEAAARVPTTRDPVGFPPIRRQVWIRFCTHGFVGGVNLVPIGFTGPGLVLLNPYRN
jgi:hypothetical protein